MAKLLTEVTFNDAQVITEGTGRDKKFYIQGPCAIAEAVNRNSRVYPTHVLEREINRYDREHIRPGSAWGEMQHPEGAKIDANNVSHRWVSVKRHGNVWEGKAIVVDTQKGDTLRGLLASGGRVGTSTRGVGSLHEARGHKIVGDDYHLITLGDCVLDPSAHSAWLEMVCENYDFFMNSATGEFERHQTERVRNQLRRTRIAHLTEEEKGAMFQDFCRLIRH